MIETQYGKKVTRGPWRTMRQIREANKAAGRFWFEPSTLRFFQSRISVRIYAGRLFVTSEKGPDMVRRYNIRAALDNAHIETVGDFQGYVTSREAHAEARRMAREIEA